MPNRTAPARLRTRPRHAVRLRALAVTLSLGLWGCAAAPAPEASGPQQHAGTAVRVDAAGTLLTARSVVQRCDSFQVRSPDVLGPDALSAPADLVAESDAADLALLRADLPQDQPHAPILVAESRHVIVPTPDMRLAQGVFLPSRDTGAAKTAAFRPSYAYVRRWPEAEAMPAKPQHTGLLEATTAPGAALFDTDGHLLGLVYDTADQQLQDRLVEAGLWPRNAYGPPAFFKDLNVIARFLSDQGVRFSYRARGRATAPQGDVPVHGRAARVTYQVTCR